MKMYIPELAHNYYGPIVIISIFIGMITACLLMKKAGVKFQTIIYTAVLTFVSILVCSAVISVSLSGDIRKVGFAGAGGALGLLVGAITSACIHRDHIMESMTAWVISAPLMYGLSKIACHIAGCCNGIPYDGFINVTYASKGDSSYFPVQLTETVTFVVIFFIGLFLFLKTLISNKKESVNNTDSSVSKKLSLISSFILLLSALAKITLEFLRESHTGTIISGYQILVLMIAISGIIGIRYVTRISI